MGIAPNLPQHALTLVMAHVLWQDFGIPSPELSLADAFYWVRLKSALQSRQQGGEK